jgi:hypothetical protein
MVIVSTDPAAKSIALPYEAPGWAQAMRRLTDHVVVDFLGGPRPWKLAWVINFQKAGTFVFLLALIAYYGNTSSAVWVYTAMQGSYGLVWILKDMAFPDPNWQRRVTIGGGINAFLGVLGWYWVFGWLLVSGVSQPDYPLPDFAWFCLCVSLCITGSAIMIAADAQNHDLRQLRDDGVALAARRGTGMGLARPVRHQHDHERSQHVTISRVGGLQETDLVAVTVRALGFPSLGRPPDSAA